MPNLFPAWAGVILYTLNTVEQHSAFPRMGGGDPRLHTEQPTELDFSPHGRG